MRRACSCSPPVPMAIWPPDSAGGAVICHGGTNRLPSSSCLCQAPCLEPWLLRTRLFVARSEMLRGLGWPPSRLCKSPCLLLAAAGMGSQIGKLSRESGVEWGGSHPSAGIRQCLFLLLFTKALLVTAVEHFSLPLLLFPSAPSLPPILASDKIPSVPRGDRLFLSYLPFLVKRSTPFSP